MSYADYLREALAEIDAAEKAATFASVGVTDQGYRHACRGWAIPISEHLRLCVAADISPLTGRRSSLPAPIGTFHRPTFACAWRMRRIVEGWSLRAAEKATTVSYSSLRRIEAGFPVSTENVLTICAFMARNPYDFVTRETSVAQKSQSEPVTMGSP